MFCVVYVDLPSTEYLQEIPSFGVECEELNEREKKELVSVLEENVRFFDDSPSRSKSIFFKRPRSSSAEISHSYTILW